MKGFNLSLKYYLAGTVLLIGVGLVVGYTFLAGSFFREGIDTYIVSQMDGVAKIIASNRRCLNNPHWMTCFMCHPIGRPCPANFSGRFPPKTSNPIVCINTKSSLKSVHHAVFCSY